MSDKKETPVTCAETAVHADKVDTVRVKLPDDVDLYDLAEFFRIFGDSTRIRILYSLYESEMCVCDLAELLQCSQSAVSHQLALLRANKLVRYRRDGKTVYYSLDDGHIGSILQTGMEHIKER